MDNRNYDGIRWSQKNGYWINKKFGYQHRYVYEKLTGLKVFDYQVVHHLDGNKSNNTAENLVCMTKSDHMYLHSMLDERGKKWGESNKGKFGYWKGKKLSEEAKRKSSESHKGKTGYWKNKTRDDETREKISKAHKGKPQQKLICPYCKKEGGISNMKRWHFDNCRNKGA